MNAHSMSIVEVRCDAVPVGERHRKDLGEIEVLAASIATEGLLQPIGITEENVLVFGERRLRAFQDLLRRETIPARVVHVRGITAGEYAENEIRKDFTESERVAIANAMEDALGNRQGQRTDIQVPCAPPDKEVGDHSAAELRENFPEVQPGARTAEIAARMAGFGNRRTYEQAKKVVEMAVDEVIEQMDSEQLAVSAAAAIADETPERQRNLEVLAASIATEGLLQPIGSTEENVLVFGERRLRASQDVLRRETIPAREVHVRSITAGEYAENELREDFAPSERVAIGKTLEVEVGDRQGQRSDIELWRNCAKVERGREALDPVGATLRKYIAEVEPGLGTEEIAARKPGSENRTTYEQAKKVVDQGAPEPVKNISQVDPGVKTRDIVASAASFGNAPIANRGAR